MTLYMCGPSHVYVFTEIVDECKPKGLTCTPDDSIAVLVTWVLNKTRSNLHFG